MSEIERPIFVIGAARSGTSMLGEILSHHPDLGYWLEPKYIWRYRNPRSPTDARGADEVTPEVARYIRRRMRRHLTQLERPRCLEKTPSNTLRVSFMNGIFPEGLFVHIVRDGRDVAFSAAKKWSSPPDPAGLWRRLLDFQMPLRDVPSYAAAFLRDVVGRQLRPDQAYIWGPHVPDLRTISKRHSLIETCGIQWRECVESARRSLAEIEHERHHTVLYEDLVREPREAIRRVLDFADLAPSAEVLDFAADHVRPELSDKWRERSGDDLDLLLPHIRETLERYGYPISQST